MPSKARLIASFVAPRMLCSSISSTLADPKWAWIWPSAASASNSPQSASRNSRVTRTAPATTGPASAPRPTSSKPIRLSNPSIFFRSKLRSWRRFGIGQSRSSPLPAPLHPLPGLGKRQLVQLACGEDDLVGRPEVELGEVAKGAGPEALDDPRRLLLDERPGALLQGAAEAPRQRMHPADILGAGDDRGRGHDRILLSPRPHPQVEVPDPHLRELPLG